jgi:hypothetical protein
MKFKAWKDWCDKSRKNKYFEKKKLLIARTEGIRCERLLKKCFMQMFNINMKKLNKSWKLKFQFEKNLRKKETL